MNRAAWSGVSHLVLLCVHLTVLLDDGRACCALSEAQKHRCYREIDSDHLLYASKSALPTHPGSSSSAGRSAMVRVCAIAAPPRPSKTEQATPLQLGYTMPGAFQAL